MEGILILSVRYWTLLEDPGVVLRDEEEEEEDEEMAETLTSRRRNPKWKFRVGGASEGDTESVTFYFVQ